MRSEEGAEQCGRQLAVRQAAAVLANQHFIFPVNTCTDVTVHFLTLTGGPTTPGPSVARRQQSLYSFLG